MFNDLTGLGYGLVVFAVVIGVGTVVLVNFGGSVSSCSGMVDADGGAYIWNGTVDKCQNTSGVGSQVDPTSTAWTNTHYLYGQLGQSGLAGWTPAIVAISIGILFLGAFMIRGGRKGKY